MSVSALFSYLDIQTCLILGSVFLLACWYLRTRTPPNLPPGPWALPGLGNVLQMFAKAPYLMWTELGRTYGPVIYLRLGSQRIVVLNSYAAVHEALVRKGEDFSSRPAWYTFRLMDFVDYGIVMLPYGPFWKQQRKFTITGLRDFGFGKRSLEGKILEEIQGLREEILKKGEKPFSIRLPLQNAVGNVICSIVLGKRFEYNDKKFEKIMKAFDQNVGFEQQVASIANFFPWARHIPVVKRAIAKVQTNLETCLSVMREDIAAHKKTFDPNDIRDFIDIFLLEMRNKEGEEGNDFTDKQLEYLIGDLFIAGTETTSSTLTWALLYMLRHPDVQENVHREIDQTIGQNVTPSVSHRSQLPYTEAVLAEVMRINPLAANGVMHNTSHDTTLFGYDIPKDTTVFPNLWAVLHDPEVYPEPDVFKPERFLDDSGQFRKGDNFIPFSMGRRVCLGEQLARMELFLFFTSLMQHFTFKLPGGAPLPSTTGKVGVTNTAEDFDLHAIPRE
ncbi:cytochrome P450 2J1-like [Branchiostoma floridae x Branchiostoma belcheri]